ncbi:MAG TPA: flagellar motor switch phosphatase FliY, partial [Clostridia bacterium]|nr:flagellar motor switch phosphatase FliY [Clostridia bacterium]
DKDAAKDSDEKAAEEATTEKVIAEDRSEPTLVNSMEKDVLGEIANISMGSAATTLSALVGKKVDITTPKVSVSTIEEIKEKYSDAYFILKVNYKKGLEGANIMILHTYDVGIIVDLMMGGDGTNPPAELNDIHLSAVSEAMSQMMGTSSTSVSQLVNKRIEIFSPIFKVSTFDDDELFEQDDEKVVFIRFQLEIADLVDSEMIQILPIPFAKAIVNEIMNINMSNLTEMSPAANTEATPAAASAPSKKGKSAPPAPEVQPVPAPAAAAAIPTDPVVAKATPGSTGPGKNIEIAPVQFPDLSASGNTKNDLPNIDLIMDIALQLSVELGRTNKKIKDILELTNGSIIELDKLAGEPVDILINGKLLAHGEVVVIDENFGVRVTGIISPEERVKSLR